MFSKIYFRYTFIYSTICTGEDYKFPPFGVLLRSLPDSERLPRACRRGPLQEVPGGTKEAVVPSLARKMNVYDSMENPRTVMISPTVPGVISPGFASPGETVITVGRHASPVRRQHSPPKLLNTCKNVRGVVDVMVFKIEGFADSAGMMDKTDPFVR